MRLALNRVVIFVTLCESCMQAQSLNTTVAGMIYLNTTVSDSGGLSTHLSDPTTSSINITKGSSKIVTVQDLDPLRCRTGPVPEQPYIKPCCEYHYEKFLESWTDGDIYITTSLEKFQRWGCPQLKSECQNPTLGFTKYTKLVYQRFCNPTKLQRDCSSTVEDVIKRHQFMHPNDVETSHWTSLVASLNSDRMDWNDLSKPCIQLALFDRHDGGVGRFHEIVEVFVPYCGVQWDGFDYETAMNRFVSPWTTMTAGCRTGIVIGMVVMGFGCLITIVCNMTILYVFGTSKKLQNSQATYKISLGVADVMVGFIVWPNMIAMQYVSFFTPRMMGDIIKRPYLYSGSKYPYDNPNLTYRYGGWVFRYIFPPDYLQVIGFFVFLSIAASAYTLMVASADRLLAISMPIKYGRHTANKFAKISCIVVWSLSIIIAVTPIFASERRYQVLSSILISATGTTALIELLIALVIPLFIILILSVATFLSSRKHARNRQQIVAHQQRNVDYEKNLEKRLAKTLALMVGAFTVSMSMAICCTLVGLLSPNITWIDPKNLDITSATAYTTSEYLSVILLSTNSIWNFFVYNWRNKGFRQEVKTLLRKTNNKPGIRHVRLAGLRVLSMARSASSYTTVTIRRYSAPFTFSTKSTRATADTDVASTTRQRSSLESINILENTRSPTMDTSIRINALSTPKSMNDNK